ncbi:hypothetical protein [Pseudoclavibacter sp. RFBA6]|uniref:hypothetical protein n=1 Tax=Pseudoclavibacter sp. RFBA6 TaxID=2080573 RepID=UPI0011B0AB15|nr:hypothetical protein [Pseudoclavibacter sp. RFBA6]
MHPSDYDLEYSEFYELITILSKDWEPVSGALGKKSSTLPLLETFERLRNTVGHSRQLLPFEEELLSGIAGLIRNRVVINLSTSDPVGEYYPRIESVRDGFGNSIEPMSADVRDVELAGIKDTGLVVRPGDVVHFTCVGVDPQGRKLNWEVSVSSGGVERGVSESGMPFEFEWTVLEKDISEFTTVTFVMSASGAKYHRAGSHDHRAFFAYKARPSDHP